MEDAGSKDVEEGIPSVIEDIRRGDELRAAAEVIRCARAGFGMGGRRLGLYSSWEDCDTHMKGFSGVVHAGMPSIEEANDFSVDME
ncbi:hypothetical protein QJS10_CPB18g00944 [Acorus calamus]|uniref:Ribonuclease H1 N-terminal domain-containing protein n=1 Tax=Acorus calamus TaxID=4465 RepID=A0AAV9CL07_ACOCL|nr:hypothetical protein QJS10_CPB18g00944 [Acorus calamus]